MTSPLLSSLPAELREQIIEYAVIDDFALEIVHPICAHSTLPSSRIAQPALARVCRQLRREVLPTFYSRNVFQLTATVRFKVRDALTIISSRDRPGWLQRDTASEVQFISIMQYCHGLMQNFGVIRTWLRRIGPENQRMLGRIYLFCAESDIDILRELMGLRYDYKSLQLVESDAAPLLDGWSWTGREDLSAVCRTYLSFPNGTHFKFALCS